MFSLALSIGGALLVLWVQARWVLSAALRALDAQSDQLFGLEVSVLERWIIRLEKGGVRAQRLELSLTPTLFVALRDMAQQIKGFRRDDGSVTLWGGAQRGIFPPDAQERLRKVRSRVRDSERLLLAAFRECPWSVDRGAEHLVETIRFHRRLAFLHAEQQRVFNERCGLTQNRCLRLFCLV